MQKCCREIFSWNRAVKFLVKLCCYSFLRKPSSKVPRIFQRQISRHFSRDNLRLQMPNFMEFSLFRRLSLTTLILGMGVADLFWRRFREGISFPNFVERSVLKLPVLKRCAVPFALQNRAFFEGKKRGEKVPRQGQEEGRPTKGAKRKKGRVKTGQTFDL